MKYYVKVILENGLISQDIDVFSTMEEAKMFKNLAEKAGNKAEIYEIELIPAELEKLHEYKIASKLSVEKLQEHLLPYKKGMVQKIIDEKMQLVTADEFLKLHKESLTDIRENDKLQEQLNTAKKALTEIQQLKRRDTTNLGMINKLQTIAKEALAAIENEGSGDE